MQSSQQSAGLLLGRIDGYAVVGAILGKPEGLPQAGNALLAAEQLPGPQNRQHHVQFGLPGRGLPEDVQTIADLDVLDLAQPAVHMQQHVVEGIVFGALRQPKVVIHLGRAHQRPDLLAYRG